MNILGLQKLIAGKKKFFLVYLYIMSTFCIVFKPFLKQLTYIDEIIVLIVAIYSIGFAHIYKRKEVLVTFAILLAYLVYSLIIGVNKSQAAIYDFIIFLKPFICFIVAKQLKVNVSKSARKCLKLLYLILGAYCLSIIPFMDTLYSNNAAYYPACIICAISYLYFSEKRNKDWIIALALLSPGLLTARSKFFTEYVFFIFIAFVLKKRVHFNLKWFFVFSILIFFSIYISWNKFSAYFIHANVDEVARTALYVKSVDVVKDYIPLGPGFGTYGTEAAAKYYSPLYHKYRLDYVWGLREVDYGGSGHDFLKDTFYPVLAQFGIIGVILYIVFWWKRWKESLSLERDNYKLFLFIFSVISIQNIAANSFTGSLGVPLMMMLGFIISNFCHSKEIKRLTR